MTLGPKFFCCSKMAVTRRRSKLWWRKAHQSKALVELQRSRRSKRDLKPSGIQFYTVFNDFHVKKMSFSKKCRKSILTGVEIRKKLRWIRICSPFCLKPSKMMIFYHFYHFLAEPNRTEPTEPTEPNRTEPTEPNRPNQLLINIITDEFLTILIFDLFLYLYF